MNKLRILFTLAVFFTTLSVSASTAFTIGQLAERNITFEDAGLEAELACFKVVKMRAGYLTPEALLDFLGRGGDTSSHKESGLTLFFSDPLAFKNQFGLLAVLLCILIGGLALNLTPCVLPMIPINLAILGVGGQVHSGRGFAMGSAYGFGIACVYGLLGGAAVVTGSLFGAIQSTWWFNVSVAALFIVLGMAMFDVIHIDFTALQGKTAKDGHTRKGYSTAMALGAVSAMLAGACVAPVVIAVILLAATMGTAGLLLPFVLGLGMALPWPFAAAGVSVLPKPGKWMVYIKYGFGIIMLVFAFNYGSLGYRALFPATAEMAPTTHASVLPMISSNQYPQLRQMLQQARTAQRQVLLDFRADWCKNCKAMETSTFTNPVIASRLQQYQFIGLDCNQLNDPKTRKLMHSFAIKGLPTLVLLQPTDL